MHNYAGNNTAYPLALSIPDDGVDVPDFAVVMTSVEGLADRTAFTRLQTSPLDFLPNYTFTPIGGAVPATVGAFDPVTLKWLTAGFQSGSGHITFWTGSGDGDLTWTLMVSPSPYTGGSCDSMCRGIEATSPVNKYVYAGVLGGVSGPGDLSVLRIDTSASTATITTLPWGVISDATSTRIASISGSVVLVTGSSVTAHSGVFWSTNSGGTWTNTGLGFGVPVPEWLVAQIPGNGEIMIIPILAVAGGTGYITTNDGVTFTPRTGLTSLPLLATETPSTLCYGFDPVSGNPCWILTTFESVATQTHTYRSFDGINWSAFSNSLPAGIALVSMAAVGQTLVANVFESGPARVIYSIDGGSTWLKTNTEAMWTSTLGTVASNNQFFLCTDVAFNFSKCLGSPGGIGSK